MELNHSDFVVQRLGECRVPSPMKGIDFVKDHERVLYPSTLSDMEEYTRSGKKPPSFELAGPRERIFFDPSELRCGIVTSGGLCPGLNDVIRAVVLGLYYHYGVRSIYGFRYGFEGLTSKFGHPPVELTPEIVNDIHKEGGTILGSSRGPQDVSDMVDTLEDMGLQILFTVGGDGTLRGAQAISREIQRRSLEIAVIGVPKTIDNDISYMDMSFGFETAVAETRTAIYSAHNEARGARNGIGLVKLMGRESGFIAAHASLANNDVNFCLVPEVPFSLEAFLRTLRERLTKRGHAVIVVGEGAGQELMEKSSERDPSGNLRFGDIGTFLRDRIKEFLDRSGMDFTLKYIDPSYTIRSMPANPRDSAFCLVLGHNAVHAGMAGRTNMVVGHWNGDYTHVPIPLAVSKRKQIEPGGRFWNIVLSCTGQPAEIS
ncbi:MAG: ATP-dependent 6-phosphofructokinase [Deltaproteobacteria bacterium]|nr:ATP-dependent 6-phosphofructokinase [Deltaproteobacteria bacterium]